MQEVTEAQLQANIIELAKLGGWMHMHITDSRRSAAVGYPDLTLVHPATGRLIFAEPKRANGKLRPEQETWLAALSKLHDAVVWRPEHWQDGTISSVLLGGRKCAA